jgi:phage gp45-like
VTSISGESAGVVTRGEVRKLPVYGPGGYAWRPATGETVLVIKGGTGGEESCVAGAKQGESLNGLQPGEVYIHAKGGSIYLKNDGTVEVQGGGILLNGRVDVNGSLYVNGALYKPCTCS